MNLLIITQKVNKNDPILGFFHRWIIEFSKHVALLTVICLEEGEHDLPDNVRVLSLGKEKGVGKVGRLVRLYSYVWKYRNDYDVVFVHMNPIYVVLCWKLWFILQKKVFLWYTHKHVDTKLRFANVFVKKIFTASSESMRLRTDKKFVTGHGIDTDFFSPVTNVIQKEMSILTVGRISKTKQVDILIRAIEQLPGRTLDIVGGTVTEEDSVYRKFCEELVKNLGVSDRVIWHGPMTHEETRYFYRRAGVFVNVSNTGSLDKVILEALACGVSVISSNDAARDLVGVRHIGVMGLGVLVDAFNETLYTPDLSQQDGRSFVIKEHGLSRCVRVLVTEME